uniref:Pap fibrillin n=1 Tax=Tetraselmis sp. GSL018 TaxID=582737 RepID=A0A061QR53_9CHLO
MQAAGSVDPGAAADKDLYFLPNGNFEGDPGDALPQAADGQTGAGGAPGAVQEWHHSLSGAAAEAEPPAAPDGGAPIPGKDMYWVPNGVEVESSGPAESPTAPGAAAEAELPAAADGAAPIPGKDAYWVPNGVDLQSSGSAENPAALEGNPIGEAPEPSVSDASGGEEGPEEPGPGAAPEQPAATAGEAEGPVAGVSDGIAADGSDSHVFGDGAHEPEASPATNEGIGDGQDATDGTAVREGEGMGAADVEGAATPDAGAESPKAAGEDAEPLPDSTAGGDNALDELDPEAPGAAAAEEEALATTGADDENPSDSAVPESGEAGSEGDKATLDTRSTTGEAPESPEAVSVEGDGSMSTGNGAAQVEPEEGVEGMASQFSVEPSGEAAGSATTGKGLESPPESAEAAGTPGSAPSAGATQGEALGNGGDGLLQADDSATVLPDLQEPPLADPLTGAAEGLGSEAAPAGELDEESVQALRDAMDDIMEAVRTAQPGPDMDAPAAQADGVAETIQDAVRQDSIGQQLLSGIRSLAEELHLKFQEFPAMSYLPWVGRALAYVLAAVGIAYLMRESVTSLGASLPGMAKKEQPRDDSSAVEPDAISGGEPGGKPDSKQQEGLGRTVVAAEHMQAEEGAKADGKDSGTGLADPQVEGTAEADAKQEKDGQTLMVNEESGAAQPQDTAKSVVPWLTDDPAGWTSLPAAKDWQQDRDPYQKPYQEADRQDQVFDVQIPDSSLAPAQQYGGLGPSELSSWGAVLAGGRDDLRVQDMDALAERRRAQGSEIGTERTALKEKLWWAVRGLGPTAAIVPGGEDVRMDIDKLITSLEAITPMETPLNTQADANEYKYMRARPKAHPHLLGMWHLEYASNTQVVQQNMMQQVLRVAEAIPGFGVGSVVQQLQSDVETDSLKTENTAVFGLGPMGSWQITVRGSWKDNGGGVCAKASFNSFSVRPVEIMGFAANALPEVRVPVPAELQAEIEWCTTYCDRDFRVGRGTDGNLFVFRKCSDQK